MPGPAPVPPAFIAEPLLLLLVDRSPRSTSPSDHSPAAFLSGAPAPVAGLPPGIALPTFCTGLDEVMLLFIEPPPPPPLLLSLMGAKTSLPDPLTVLVAELSTEL